MPPETGRLIAPGIRRGFWMRVYDAVLPFAAAGAWLVARFHRKLREALRGKQGGIKRWRLPAVDQRPLVLVHVASAGEFEAALPLIQRLTAVGGCRVAVSYSSPSAVKPVSLAEGIWASGYLPKDYYYEQVRFLGILEPAVVVVVKHDFWPNTLRAAGALRIPVVIADANFHPGSLRNLPPTRPFQRTFMRDLTAVWTVSEADAERAAKLLTPGTDLQAVGDTRYDRVRQRASRGAERFAPLREALKPGPVIVLGSSWPPGEDICWRAFAKLRQDHPTLRMLIAPHEPTAEALDRNRERAKASGVKVRLLSQWGGEVIESEVVLVDGVGLLAEIYAVGWAAYVGGGFGKGVHSVIEPAAHELPVAFGPRHQVSHEAGLLLNAGGGFVVRDAADLERLWRGWLEDAESHRRAALAAAETVRSREGATDRLVKLLQPFLA